MSTLLKDALFRMSHRRLYLGVMLVSMRTQADTPAVPNRAVALERRCGGTRAMERMRQQAADPA